LSIEGLSSAARQLTIGVKVAIHGDTHSAEQLRFMSYGIDQARPRGLEKEHVINTMGWPQFDKWLKKTAVKNP
jgi:histidinol phosphatase-like PHP family hydrolase